MSKAILVLPEMPENCENCPLENKMYVSCIVMCRRTSKFKGARPDWCPLCPMPERVYYGKDCSEWDDGYQSGVADVLRAIGGSGEDAKSC